MLAQTFMSSRSLTQGLDIINMEPSAPGVRTSVINSYLSNSGSQNGINVSNPNALMASLETDINLVQGNNGGVPVNAAPSTNAVALIQHTNQDPTVVSPKIYSVIKNSIAQALNDQVANSQSVGPGPSSNVNALLTDQVSPGSMVDAAGAQINSFVNSLIFTVQAQTNLSPQGDILGRGLIGNPSPSENIQPLVMNSTNNLDQLSSQTELGQPQSSGLNLNSNSNITDVHPTYMGYPSSADTTGNFAPAQSVSSQENSVLGNAGGQNSYTDSSSLEQLTQQQETAQNISNVHGWVVGRIYSGMQSMIEMLAVNQSQNAQQPGGVAVSTSTAGLDSLIQSANSLFASMGLTSTVAASTLQTALQDIQRNLMSAPAQGQWINVVA
jgi:hypothetical protein